MTKYYTFAEISMQYKKQHNFIAYGYRKAIELLERGIIKKDIRKLVIDSEFVGKDINRRYKAKLVHEKNLKEFKSIIQYTKDNLFIKPKKPKIPPCENWNDDSIYCYSIKSMCNVCNIAKLNNSLLSECKMNDQVEKLLKIIGEPKNV
jgi:hypothetical protein